MVGEIILNETQKVSSTREAFLDSDCGEKNKYKVENMSLEETKEKLECHKRAL